MKTVLEPYVFQGGGAKNFMNMESGSFQQLSKDLLSATVEIPFSIPAYFSLLGRAVVSLEGIALVGDPDYKMVNATCNAKLKCTQVQMYLCL